MPGFRTPLIFPKYGDDAVGENGCVMTDSFTSSANIGGGTLIGDSVAGAIFSGAGYAPEGSSAVQFTSSVIPTINDLINGFTVYMEVSKDFFSSGYSPSVLGYLFRFKVAGATARGVWHRQNNPHLQAGWSANINTALRDESLPDYVPVWITGGYGWYEVHINYLLGNNGSWDVGGTTVTEIDIGGLGTAGAPSLSDGRTIRNVAVYSRSMPKTARRVISVHGDSFVNQGTYSTDLHAITAETPDGQTQAGYFNGSTLNYLSGMAPAMHAALLKNGASISGGRILHWGEGGQGVTALSGSVLNTNLSGRMDVAVSGRYPIPEIALFCVGTNDLNSTALSDYTDGTYAAAYQAVIDKLPSTTKKIIFNLIGRTDVDHQAKITACNDSAIPAVAAATGATVIDMFTKTGGHNIGTDYLQSDGVHPNPTCQALYASEGAGAVLSLL